MRGRNMMQKSEITEVPFEIETPKFRIIPPDTWLTYHLAHPGRAALFLPTRTAPSITTANTTCITSKLQYHSFAI